MDKDEALKRLLKAVRRAVETGMIDHDDFFVSVDVGRKLKEALEDYEESNRA